MSYRVAHLEFPTLKLLGLLVSTAAIWTTADASTLSRIHLKFVQPPHIQEHAITTDGDRIVSQRSYVSIGRRLPSVNSPLVDQSFQSRLVGYYPRHLVARPRFIPQPTAYAPVEENELNYSTREYNHITPDFSDGLAYPDPYLLTGDAALLAVKYIYGRGELFFHDIPHVRSLLRNQEERRKNGLNGNILSSLRVNSPFLRRE